MTGQMVKLPEDEDTPEKVRTSEAAMKVAVKNLLITPRLLLPQRVDKLFKMMDKDKNAQRECNQPSDFRLPCFELISHPIALDSRSLLRRIPGGIKGRPDDHQRSHSGELARMTPCKATRRPHTLSLSLAVRRTRIEARRQSKLPLHLPHTHTQSRCDESSLREPAQVFSRLSFSCLLTLGHLLVLTSSPMCYWWEGDTKMYI